MLGFSYYLHEKAEESRHNETVGLLISVLGSVLLVGGILQTLLMTQSVEWFFILPYQSLSSPYGLLSLGFTVIGIVLFLVGILLSVYYAAQRSWYSNALKEDYRAEEMKRKARKEGLSEASSSVLHPLPEATQPSYEDTLEVQSEAQS